MNRILFTTLIFLKGITMSFGQCVIYACDNTGAFGAGFNNDGAPTTIQECTDVAKKMCKEKGGTSCTLLYKSNKSGWWALISGKKSNGANYFQGGDGYSSKSVAETSVRNKYRADGGVDADKVQVYSWYAYSNPK